MLTRRAFHKGSAALAFSGLANSLGGCDSLFGPRIVDYGPLVADPAGLLDLPEGFAYQVISSFGETMSDGYRVPDRADGMGCFPLGGSRVSLVRNHELGYWNDESDGPFKDATLPDILAFDRDETGKISPGGTTTIVYDLVTGERVEEYLSLVGTIRNCAGGVTPWGSWLTCEENVTTAGEGAGKDHGWVFEVPADQRGLIDPVPLKDMGRFNHEAAAIDPRTGIVYLTEDRDDSLLYRFIPNEQGKLLEGGRLQALVLKDKPEGADTRNWEAPTAMVGAWRDASWIDLDNVESPEDDLRHRGHAKGAAIFARGEGIHWGDEELYFCCTSGGATNLGQVFEYVPSPKEGTDGEAANPGRLRLFVESDDPAMLNYCDNLTVAPNGHLIICEDQYTDIVDNHLRGITPDGTVYPFAKLHAQTEPAGACFSPDGSILFVNLYSPTKTLAIRGPWGWA